MQSFNELSSDVEKSNVTKNQILGKLSVDEEETTEDDMIKLEGIFKKLVSDGKVTKK